MKLTNGQERLIEDVKTKLSDVKRAMKYVDYDTGSLPIIINNIGMNRETVKSAKYLISSVAAIQDAIDKIMRDIEEFKDR